MSDNTNKKCSQEVHLPTNWEKDLEISVLKVHPGVQAYTLIRHKYRKLGEYPHKNAFSCDLDDHPPRTHKSQSRRYRDGNISSCQHKHDDRYSEEQELGLDRIYPTNNRPWCCFSLLVLKNGSPRSSFHPLQENCQADEKQHCMNAYVIVQIQQRNESQRIPTRFYEGGN